MRMRVLIFEGCPHASDAVERVRQTAQAEGVNTLVEIVEVPNEAAAQRERFLGSPSVQIDGLDIETSRRGDPYCHGCRVYRSANGVSGLPSEEMIRAAIRRARGPKLKVLFLCTGNSCRSQMAEGWGRHLKGDVIEAYSAGIETHGLNPRAVKVMAEGGVDISAHRSKTVADVKGIEFDYVVTVCDHAHKSCPLFPGKAKVIHVGFDDPPRLAKDAKTEEEALSHYRRVRDEIKAFVERLPKAFVRDEDAQRASIKKKCVLFLCAQNSCRSQMAEAFLRKYAGDRLEAFSAGLAPQPIHPLAVRVMQEAGIDISRQRSKSVREYLGKAHFHHLIFVCEQADRNCPKTFPDIGERLFWPFEDPASYAGTDDEKLAKFREIRDQIEARIRAWIKEQL